MKITCLAAEHSKVCLSGSNDRSKLESTSVSRKMETGKSECTCAYVGVTSEGFTAEGSAFF